MGTDITALLEAGSDPDAVTRRFAIVEEACSRFRAGSDLTVLNRAPTPSVVMPSPLAEVLEAADHQRGLTGGLVDAGVGLAVRAWGYDATFDRVDGLDCEPEPMETPEWSVRGRSISRPPGTVLDLGGVAKGWTADRVVEEGDAVVVSAGGDVRSADPATVVDICGPRDALMVSVHLGVGALATSSTLRRRWVVAGRTAHHLIDPRSGRPAVGPVVAATAICTTGVEAEAAAKAVLLLGADGLAWAARQPWVRAAVVLWQDGSVFSTSGLEVA